LIRPLKLAAAAVAAVVAVASSPAVAGATGTITIHHKDGTANTYRDVEIKLFSGSLFLTTDDGNGTIVVTRAACSYQGEIIVCLPTTAALVQDGESNALNLKRGTIYLNYTGVAQPLSASSAKLPPNSVMLALTTANGTLINVRGRIDQLIKQ
jgi:hypothetical protein